MTIVTDPNIWDLLDRETVAWILIQKTKYIYVDELSDVVLSISYFV